MMDDDNTLDDSRYASTTNSDHGDTPPSAAAAAPTTPDSSSSRTPPATGEATEGHHDAGEHGSSGGGLPTTERHSRTDSIDTQEGSETGQPVAAVAKDATPPPTTTGSNAGDESAEGVDAVVQVGEASDEKDTVREMAAPVAPPPVWAGGNLAAGATTACAKERTIQTLDRVSRSQSDCRYSSKVASDALAPRGNGFHTVEKEHSYQDTLPQETAASQDAATAAFANERMISLMPAPFPSPEEAPLQQQQPGAYAVIRPVYNWSARSSGTAGQPSQEERRANHDDSSSNYTTAGLVTAELVTPPVQAIQVTTMHSHNSNNSGDQDLEGLACAECHNHSQPLTLDDTATITSSSPPPQTEESASSKGLHRRRNARFLLCGGVCVLLIVVALLVAVFASGDSQQPTAKAAPAFPYPCYNSMYELIRAQSRLLEQDVFIICPDTRIEPGNLKIPTPNMTDFEGGDYPLMIVRGNIEVRCGLDGSVHNNCVFDGGQVHLLVFYQESTQGPLLSAPVHNVTIRGLTFSGELKQDLTFGSVSVLVSHPQAKNFRMIDCHWKDMIAPSGVIHAGISILQIAQGIDGFPSQSMDLSIMNSTFSNITYDATLVRSFSQAISLEGCHFSDIQTPSYVRECWFSQDWCHGIMYCYGSSRCEMKDICVNKMDYFASTALLGVSSETEWSVSGMNSLQGLKLLSGQPFGIEAGVCKTGIGMYDGSYKTIDCVLEDENDQMWGQSLSTCPLD